MSIDPTTARAFNQDILSPLLTNVTECISNLISRHSYADADGRYLSIPNSLIVQVQCILDSFRLYFGEQITARAVLGDSVWGRAGLFPLLMNHMNIRNAFTDLMNSEVTDISDYETIIVNLKHLRQNLYTNIDEARNADRVIAAARPSIPVVRPRRRRARKSKALSITEIEEVIEDPCCICFETYTRGQSITTCCNHTFCKDCYDSHEKSTPKSKCPMCRKENPVVTEYRTRKERASGKKVSGYTA